MCLLSGERQQSCWLMQIPFFLILMDICNAYDMILFFRFLRMIQDAELLCMCRIISKQLLALLGLSKLLELSHHNLEVMSAILTIGIYLVVIHQHVLRGLGDWQ